MSPEKMMVGRLFSRGNGEICSFSGGVVWLVFCKKERNKKTAMLSFPLCHLCSSHASGVDCCFCHVDLLDGSHGLLLMALLAGMMLIPINLVTWIARGPGRKC